MKFQKKKFSYKAGVAYIKIDQNGNWLSKDAVNYYRILSHIFIAHPLDSNHYWVSFFTSHENLRADDGGFVKNFKCSSELSGLKFINSPFILKRAYLLEFVRIDENFDSINKILNIENINQEKKLKIYEEMLKNFKFVINPSYEEKVVKVLSIKQTGKKLTLEVRTRGNIWIIDEQSRVYTDKKIDILLKENVNIEEVETNFSLFLNTRDSVIAGIAEITMLLDN